LQKKLSNYLLFCCWGDN